MRCGGVLRNTAVLLSLLLSQFLHAQGTLADYERADGLRSKFQGLAFNIPERPSWIEKTSRFWYRKSVRGGHEFVLVDAQTAQKKPAFNHEKLAAVLSAASGEKYTAVTLPFSDISFVENERAVEFSAADSTWRCDLSSYSCTKTGPAQEQLRIVNGPSDFSGGALELLARRVYREFFQTDDASAVVIEGLMLEIMGESARSAAETGSRPPRWLLQAREIVRERFSEHLTLSDLAASVGVHPVHLAQTFHRHYCCTVGEFLRKLRIEYACRQLVASEASIVEIALAAGFCDQSHFTRTFKRCTGLAPAQYRDTVRGF
jgi:AraC-like DNA-binding protein